MGGMETIDCDPIDRYRRVVVFLVTVIVVFGIVMVYSSSYIYAKEFYGSSFYYLIRQAIFALLGIGLAYVISKTKKTVWEKYAMEINIFVTFILVLTLVPHIGASVKGAHRWIELFGIKFQPGEFVKATMAISSISFFGNFHNMEKKKKVVHFISILLPLVIFLFQPDFGTFSICFILVAFICYLSDFPRKIFYIFLGFGTAVSVPILLSESYRVQRIFSFLDPWKNAQGSGFQIIQSYLAFANGSIFGLGLGNSNEKLFYLPEAHNDFIFSVIGEEMGFLGVLVVVILFSLLIYFGFKISLLIDGKYSAMLVASITFLLGLQAILNMGVVLGLLPTKGLNLPFVSYGGSSLIANMFLIGLLLSCTKKVPSEEICAR